MNLYYQTTNSELYHHGILGQKWGVRRFQNRDGSLTPAGRKRQGIKESRSEKKKSKEETKKKSKTVKDMSDDELREKINRLQMERQYLDLSKQVSQLSPKQVTAGEKFVKGLEETFVPAIKNAGKNLTQQWLEKKGKELLGLKNEDSVEALKKEAQSLNYKKQINEAKKYFEAEKNNTKSSTSNSKSSDTTDKSSDSKSSDDTSSKSSNTSYKTTVEGKGTSKSDFARDNSQRGPIVDATYTDVSSRSNTYSRPVIELGETYIAGLLEDKHR